MQSYNKTIQTTPVTVTHQFCKTHRAQTFALVWILLIVYSKVAQCCV
jgi:hypothetical protein